MIFFDNIGDSPYSAVSSRGTPSSGKPFFVLLGGFLGSGKTSLLRSFSEWLVSRGLRVGLMANDQMDVDRFQRGGSPDPQSVIVGCFCRTADASIARIISMRERVDVVLAERAGSGTDLAATIMRPMAEVHGMAWRRAPYAVLVDSRLWVDRGKGKPREKATGARGGRNEGGKSRARAKTGLHFHKHVDYIFTKQLEEGDVIVVNKVDLLSKTERAAVAAELRVAFPGREIRLISTRSGEGLADLFSHLLVTEHREGSAVEVDYARYAEGNSILGCYHAEASVHAVTGAVDGNGLLRRWAREIGWTLRKQGLTVAHLKLSLENRRDKDGNEAGGLAVAQQVAHDDVPDLSESLRGKVLVGRLLIHIRAEGRGKAIRQAVRSVLGSETTMTKVRLTWRVEKASPQGGSVPRHRMILNHGKNKLIKSA